MFHWASFLTYAVVTAVTPGPNNILSMSNGSRRGFKGALPFNFGILAGFAIIMVLCTAFCSLLSTWIPKIKMPMLIVGACYMLYLAWGPSAVPAQSRKTTPGMDSFLASCCSL